jgi:adenosine kinase
MFLQWMLQIPGATSFMGCIGKDKFGEEMKNNAQAAGVNVNYNLFCSALHAMTLHCPVFCTINYFNLCHLFI